MWIKKTEYPVMDGEPQLGTITETELMGEREEAIDALCEYIEDNQELPEVFTVIDDITEFEIDLRVKDYLSNHQINTINELLMEDNEWTTHQIKVIIDYHDVKDKNDK